jgi:chorismate dehydratase
MTSVVPKDPHPNPLRISAVSFFNTAPLIYGLDHDPRLALRLGVPSTLIDDLTNDRADVALLPVIDYQRAEGLRIIPAGGIGCDGPTLTVRLFSRTPIDQTRTLAVDPDSHTSVILARILLDRVYGVRPEVIPLARATDAANETRLLIGDKVVTAEPRGFDHQLDLGEAWKRWTGLPFVFAVWTARPGVVLGDLPDRLAGAREAGLAHVDELIQHSAIPRGWPADLARKYLTDYLKFDVGPRQLQAVKRYHALAQELGFLDHCRPLKIL